MLFVLGLLLIVKDRWMLLKTVTAFTVAHSITLAIATLGYAEVPVVPLECRHCVEHSVSWAGDRALLAWPDQLHHSSSLGCRFCVWIVARFWVCQRAD